MKNQFNVNENQHASAIPQNVIVSNETNNNIEGTPKKKKERRNIYQEITNAIIDKMKEGKLLWKQGFKQYPAQNWISKKAYTGINAVLLNFLHADEVCPFYCSINQINSLGGTVKKGAKGKMIVYFSPLYKKDGQYIKKEQYQALSNAAKKEVNRFSTLKYFFVFNLLDTENCKGFDY